MKTKTDERIPRGWRKLRRGTILREGDHFLTNHGKEHFHTMYVGDKVWESMGTKCTYIRRIKKGPK